MVLLFFFSSRRRHTRYWRDWSSDVCSSDLRAGGALGGSSRLAATHAPDFARGPLVALAHETPPWSRTAPCWSAPITDRSTRSEERRVGKECRSRWSSYH